MPERIDETIVRLKADKASSDDLARRIAKLRGTLADLKAEERQLEAARRSGANVTEAFVRVITQQERAKLRLVAAEKAYRREVEGTSTAERRAAADAARIAQQRAAYQRADLYGDVESRTRAITGAIGYLGGTGIERSVNIGAELLATAEAAGKLRQELPALASSMGITARSVPSMAAAIVALGVTAVVAGKTFRELEAGAAAARQAVIAHIGAIDEMYEFLSGATQSELMARIAQLAQEQDVKRQELQALYEMRNQIDAGMSPQDAWESLAIGYVELANKFNKLEYGSEELAEAIGAVETEIATGDVLFRRYSEALASGATAANDAAQRENDYRERRIAGLEAEAQAQINAETLVRTATSASIQERLAQIDSERAALTGLRDTLSVETGTAERVRELNDQLFRLDQESARLTNSVLPAVQAREAERRAVDYLRQRLVTLYTERQKEAEAARKQAAQLVSNTQRYQESLDALTSTRTQAQRYDQEDFNRQRERALDDHHAAMAQADAAYYERRESLLAQMSGADNASFEAMETYQREQQRAARDHQREMLRIERDGDRNIQAAAERMNGAAILDARRAKELALAEEQDRYSQEQADREEDMQIRMAELAEQRDEKLAAGRQALDDLTAQHRQEQQERDAAFRLSLAREDEDRRIRLAREDVAMQQQARALAQGYAAQQGITAQHINAMNIIMDAGMSGLTNRVNAAMALISGTPRAASSPGAIPQIGSAVSGFAASAMNTISSAFGFGGSQTSNNVTVNVSGAGDPDSVAERVIRRITGALAVG